jgi:hypothetical protein
VLDLGVVHHDELYARGQTAFSFSGERRAMKIMRRETNRHADKADANKEAPRRDEDKEGVASRISELGEAGVNGHDLEEHERGEKHVRLSAYKVEKEEKKSLSWADEGAKGRGEKTHVCSDRSASKGDSSLDDSER